MRPATIGEAHMQNPIKLFVMAGAVLIAAACASDTTTSPVASSQASAALVTAPLSFDQINTSFVGSSDAANGFMPDGDMRDDHHGHRGPGFGEFMGGGLGEAFIGGIGFGPELGRGPFGDIHDSDSDDCTFSTSTNRVECPTINRHGLTINRSFSFLDASGTVQQGFDRSTTNTVNVQTSVSGTMTHHETATSTVNASSDFTVGGLASGSTKRTVDGKSAGSESTTGTKDGVAFTAERTAGDTTTGLVIPIQDGRPTFPIAGTVIRSMMATVTVGGGTPSTSSRREVITYDGSSTAQVVVTHDGVTKNCTKPLPHGRLTCQ
jgi:hypothetical protein